MFLKNAPRIESGKMKLQVSKILRIRFIKRATLHVRRTYSTCFKNRKTIPRNVWVFRVFDEATHSKKNNSCEGDAHAGDRFESS